MFADSQTITIATVANTLKRVAFGDHKGEFDNASVGVSMLIQHTAGKRVRRVVRLTKAKIVSDPLLAGVSRNASLSTTVVIDAPLTGFTPAEANDVLKGLSDWLAVAGNRDQLLNGES